MRHAMIVLVEVPEDADIEDVENSVADILQAHEYSGVEVFDWAETDDSTLRKCL